MPTEKPANSIHDLFGEAAPRPAAGGEVVQVLTPVGLDLSYSYRVPHGMVVVPGSIVQVPLGPRKVVGVVTAEPAELQASSNRLRPIEIAFDAPPLTPEMLTFVDWVARYTLTPRGMVMRMVLRAPDALEPEPPLACGSWRRNATPERLTDARRRVMALLAENEGQAWTRAGLAAAAGVLPVRRRRTGDRRCAGPKWNCLPGRPFRTARSRLQSHRPHSRSDRRRRPTARSPGQRA